MFKKFIVIMLCLTLFIGLMTGCSSNQNSESEANNNKTITLKLGHAAQTTHPFQIGAEKFAELVKEKSNGRIVIDIYPARQLGGDKELIEQVMNGTLDMGVISSPIFSNFTPLLDTLQLPFLLNTYDKELKAITSSEMKDILNALESLNMKGLAVYEGGMRHIANNVRQINKPEDLDGLKLRVVPSNLILEVMETLGANPTPMAYGEIYTGLQTNVINGEEINLTSIYSEKHYEVLEYVTVLGLFPFPGINVINLDRYNSLSDEDQKILSEAAWEAIPYVISQFTELESKATQTIKENGVKVNKIDDISAFKEKTKPIYDKYIEKDPLIKDFVEMAQQL